MTTQNKNNQSDSKHSSVPPTHDLRSLTRRCQNCSGAMQAQPQKPEKNNSPWSEKGILFVCNQCPKRVWITSSDTIIIYTLSGLLIILAIIYMLANNFMSFISMGFESGILWTLLSLVLIAVVILFAIGGIINIQRGLVLFLHKQKHPILGAPPRSNTTSMTLLLGAAPWLIVTATGYINFAYFNDSAALGFIGLALFAMPLAFAKKLGSSLREVFLSMFMWLVLGGVVIWLYNIW